MNNILSIGVKVAIGVATGAAVIFGLIKASNSSNQTKTTKRPLVDEKKSNQVNEEMQLAEVREDRPTMVERVHNLQDTCTKAMTLVQTLVTVVETLSSLFNTDSNPYHNSYRDNGFYQHHNRGSNYQSGFPINYPVKPGDKFSARRLTPNVVELNPLY